MDARFRLIAASAVLSLVFISSDISAQQGPPRRPEEARAPMMDQRALDTLKLMCETISKAKTLSFRARSMVPVKTPGGKWINLYGTSQVVVEGRDKLFASTGGDFAKCDFYFDGKTITRCSPDKNVYAMKEAPPTIDDVIENAYKEDGKCFPYADILLSEPYPVLTRGLTGALYVGQSDMGGVKTNHLAFSNKGVEWQVWIGVEDKLPRLVVATYLDEASEPSYTTEFLDWKVDAPVSADTFSFKNASNAAKVEFRNPMLKRRMVSPAALAN